MRRLMGILLSLVLMGCGADFRSARYGLDGAAELVLHNPGLTGPHRVQSYLPSGSNPGYKSVIIYYPEAPRDDTLPATTLSGGFTNTKEHMSWLGQHLASHGFIVAVFTPTQPYSLDARTWSQGHKASVETLLAESAKGSTPIAGRVDPNRIGLMGYSYGGAGTILAANELDDRVRSAVTFCAFNPQTPQNPIPMLFITGTKDTVASPGRILSTFQNFETHEPKAFAKFNQLAHGDITNGGRFHETIARYTTAWSQVFLAGMSAYDTYIDGEEAQQQIGDSSVFAKATDYIYEE
jgi:predicted dienelactone hydrolase